MEEQGKVKEGEVKTFIIQKLRVEKAVGYQVGMLKKNLNFSITVDIVDEKALCGAKAACIHTIDRFIEQEMREEGRILGTPELDINLEAISWRAGTGEKARLRPFDIADVDSLETIELREFLLEHGKSINFEGINYWLFPDQQAIGRRKIL